MANAGRQIKDQRRHVLPGAVGAAIADIQQAVFDLMNVPFLRQAWSWQRGLTLVSGANTVQHKLGRKPVGFIVTDAQGVLYVHRTDDYNTTTVELTTGAAGFADVFFF